MSMILYLGDRELFDFIFNINQDISSELSVSEADKIIVAEYSHNAVSVIRAAEEMNIPILAILDGYRSLAEAFGAECISVENCPEGKQELAVLDTSVRLHKGLGHVMSICRGNPLAVDEETMPPELDCIARAETGEIIALCQKLDGEYSNVFAVNYYLNSSLTQYGDIILKNFFEI